MKDRSAKQSIIRMNCALELEREIVGVRFIFDRQDFETCDAKQVKNKLNYCVMVKLAMNGAALKATGENLACPGGGRALGFVKTEDYQKSGQHGKNLGLYADMTTAKSVIDNMSSFDHQPYGFEVKPLDKFNQDPDAVIIVTNPYNVMRIVQGYSHYFGMQVNYKMVGNQAICSESTAYPILNNDINISMLCIGTRHQAGWKDDELAVGFPFNRFNKIVKGVMNTINAMDDNHKKAIIERRLHDNNMSDIEIKYDYNYYKNIPKMP